MKMLEQLDHLQLDEAAKTQVAALLQAALEQGQNEAATKAEQYQSDLKNKDAELHAKELKIQALMLELAHLRRIRYGVKNEALSPWQQDLFQESWDEDLASVTIEVQQLTPPPR